MKNKYFYVSLLVFALTIFSAGRILASEYQVVECITASDCDAQTCKTTACTANTCIYTDISGCGETPITPAPGGGTVITGGGGVTVIIPTPTPAPVSGTSPVPVINLGPIISNIKETIGLNSISLSWDTDKSSLSWIIYGQGNDYKYSKQIKETGYRTTHLLNVGNLLPNTKYHYMIVSNDTVNEFNFSADRNFTTKIQPSSYQVKDTPAPSSVPVQKSKYLMIFVQRIIQYFVNLF